MCIKIKLGFCKGNCKKISSDIHYKANCPITTVEIKPGHHISKAMKISFKIV